MITRLRGVYLAVAFVGVSCGLAVADNGSDRIVTEVSNAQGQPIAQAYEISSSNTGNHLVYSLQPEPFSDAEAVLVSLPELLENAVANNLGLGRQFYSLEQGHFGVDKTYYAFDPTFSGSLTHSRRAFGGSAAAAGGGLSGSQTYNLNARYIVPREYGDSFSFDYNLGESSYSLLGDTEEGITLPTTFSSGFTLSYSRPFSRGAGRYINRIPRFISSNNLVLSYDLLDDQIRNLKKSVMDLFFQAVSAREAISTREASLDLALQQLERAVERYKVGLGIKMDVLQAENSVLNQRSQLLTAKDSYASLLDQLVVLSGCPIEIQLTVSANEALVELDGEIPEHLWELVSQNSYDLKALNTQLANLMLTHEQQTNLLKPGIGLTMSYGRSGEDTTIAQAIGGNENENFSIGVNWNLNPKERFSKAGIAQTELDIASLELSIQETELQLKSALRGLQRDISEKRQQIELSESNREVLQESHKIQVARSSVGLATTLDVVEAQESLLAGELALLNAKVAYQTAYRELQLMAGLI